MVKRTGWQSDSKTESAKIGRRQKTGAFIAKTCAMYDMDCEKTWLYVDKIHSQEDWKIVSAISIALYQ